MGQSTEELILSIRHGTTKPFEDGLGVALAAVAGEMPQILDGTAGRHNERDLALAVFNSRHDPADAFPLRALEVTDNDALAHELMSPDLADARVGLNCDFHVGPDILETAARMRQELLCVDLDGRKHPTFDVFDAQTCLNTCESRTSDQRVVYPRNQIAGGRDGPLGCNPGGRNLGNHFGLADSRPEPGKRTRRLLQLLGGRQHRRYEDALHVTMQQLPHQGPLGHLYGRSLTRGNDTQADGVAVELGRTCSEEIVDDL